MLTAFDLLLICGAIIFFFAGFLKQKALWTSGRKETLSTDFLGLIQYIVGHKIILRNPLTGIPHLFLFWGFLIPLCIIVLSQFDIILPGGLSNALSLLMDVLGLFMLLGILFFLKKRVTATDTAGPKNSVLPVLLLLLILVTGFMAEGSRLSIVHPGVSMISPVGWVFSIFTPDSPRFMQVMIRLHFFGVLLFFALIPFTFMRHIPAGLQNVYHRKQGRRGELNTICLDRNPIGPETVFDFSQKQLLEAQACVSCGRCKDNCPASLSGKPLSPRKIMQDIYKQMAKGKGASKTESQTLCLESDITPDEIWACTTCMACVEHCPVFIEPMDKIIDIRRHLVMDKGLLPKEARSMIRNLELFGDVQGKGIALRTNWAWNENVPVLSDKTGKQGVLVWIGCSGAFHPRYSKVAKNMAQILTAGGVEFAILGNQEICCGDPARRLGEESLFQDLARRNIETLKAHHFEKIIALCPHCFNTLKNEYPAFGGQFDVVSAVPFLLELIEQRKIHLKYPVNKRMTLHDPCYLGRVNHIYEPLRAVMTSVPGIELKELNHNRSTALCCGGGGGRMWLHESLGENINMIRAREVKELNVDGVGTACPYCLTMLDDGTKSLSVDPPPEVFDIIEIVASSLGVNR